MARLHLVSAEIGGGGPATFRFDIGRLDGCAAQLEIAVPLKTTTTGVPDIARTFAAARAELVTTLLHALIDANRLDNSLAPCRQQTEPNSDALLDLRRPSPANDDHWPRVRRAGGTS